MPTRNGCPFLIIHRLYHSTALCLATEDGAFQYEGVTLARRRYCSRDRHASLILAGTSWDITKHSGTKQPGSKCRTK